MLICLKFAGWVANSVNPDQTPRSVVSDLGLNCLPRHVCPYTKGSTVSGNIYLFIYLFSGNSCSLGESMKKELALDKTYKKTSATSGCAVWSEPSLIPCAFYRLQAIQRGMTVDPCHTGWMYRLIWVFAGHKGFPYITIVQSIYYFFWDHLAHCGVLLMYTLKGVSRVANFITAYEESQ